MDPGDEALAHLRNADHEVALAQRLLPGSHEVRPDLISIRQRLHSVLHVLEVKGGEGCRRS